jgi:hypothetical protein
MRALSCIAIVLALSGCTGVWGDDDPNQIGARCEGEPRPGPSGLRRLTPAEYENTIGDLFPGVPVPDLTLSRDGSPTDRSVFDNDMRGQTVSPLRTEEFQRAAVAVAGAAVNNLDRWAPCTENTTDCAARIAVDIAERAQRRPLSEEDRTTFTTFIEGARVERGLNEAVAMLLEAILQSPQFLYRPEIGITDGAPEGLAQLDDFEVASRLSYFLWRTMPDAELRDAAASGSLSDVEGLEAQARRMLEDPRASASLADLHSQWFELGRLDTLEIEPSLYPDFSPALRGDIRSSADRFFADTFAQGEGGLETLFAGRHAYVNDRLASIYGVDPPGTDELVRVELDGDRRAGILTQAAFLAARSKPTVHSPILRGTFVLSHVLCSPAPPPPPGADTMTTALPEGTIVTTRERTTLTHSGVSICASCHTRIDGAGFAFENYDALGHYRETEFGLPVDARTTLVDVGDASGGVDGAVELGERLADSDTVRACVATHYFRYAMGRGETDYDRCQIRSLADRLRESNGDLRELVIAMIVSPSFRFRATEETP